MGEQGESLLAKFGAVEGKPLLFTRLLTGERGQVAIITKLSPHYVLTESTIFGL